jgi:hypothetical protein
MVYLPFRYDIVTAKGWSLSRSFMSSSTTNRPSETPDRESDEQENCDGNNDMSAVCE